MVVLMSEDFRVFVGFSISYRNFPPSNELKVNATAQSIAKANDFVIKSYGFEAIKEDLRKPRIVRIGAIQHSLVEPTSAPVSLQRDRIFEKVGKLLDAAAADKVNILCLQELWSEL
jgi:beta-ureidopropionase